MLKMNVITISTRNLLLLLLLVLFACDGFVRGSEHIERDQLITKQQFKSQPSRPTVTRTQLRVSKSLNPDDMQELNVRSNNGGVATILVKRRDGKSTKHSTSGSILDRYPDGVTVTSSAAASSSTASTTVPRAFHASDVDLINSLHAIANENVSTVRHSQRISRSEVSQVASPSSTSLPHNDRRPVHIAVPEPVVISSAAQFVKDAPAQKQQQQQQKRARSATFFGSNTASSRLSFDEAGIPVVEGIRMPDDDEDKVKTWRNARVINGELVPYEKGYKPPKAEPFGDHLQYGQLVYLHRSTGNKGKASTARAQSRGIGPFTTTDNYLTASKQPASASLSGKSIGPFSVEDNRSAATGRQETMATSGSGGIGPFTIYDNSRAVNAKLIAYIKQINEQESHRDYFARRSSRYFDGSDGLVQQQAVQPESRQIQRRMLQTPAAIGEPVYAPSLLYSSGQQNAADAAMLEARRTPVLEYAHPELGVQAAKTVPGNVESTGRHQQHQYTSSSTVSGGSTPAKVQYYAASDSPAVAYEPRRPLSANIGEYFTGNAQQQQQQDQHTHQSMYAPKNPATYPYNYGYLRKVKEQPFYVKFAEQMRDSFQNGVATVQEMTRPVLEPLVEAGQKISRNLGLSKETDASNAGATAQDKVGGALSAGAASLGPTIGLVAAGGAALGLGAMAVNRIFDGNMLRSVRLGGIDLDDEEQRLLTAVRNAEEMYVRGEPHGAAARRRRHTTITIRNKRSIDDFELQGIENGLPDALRQDFEMQIRNTDWSDTPCAKKVFCEVMLRQGSDDVVLMEKKLDTLLAMMHPTLGQSLSAHLSEVTDAIRRRDCAQFICEKSS